MGKVQQSEIKNKKAYFDYEVLETYEAGMVLQGSEVKSIRLGKVNLKGNFVHEWHGDLWVEGMYISPYSFAVTEQQNPMRKRKLLLHKKELAKIIAVLAAKGTTATVLELYFKNKLLKAKLGIVRGKKQFDKRDTLKRKDQERSLQRALKHFGR